MLMATLVMTLVRLAAPQRDDDANSGGTDNGSGQQRAKLIAVAASFARREEGVRKERGRIHVRPWDWLLGAVDEYARRREEVDEVSPPTELHCSPCAVCGEELAGERTGRGLSRATRIMVVYQRRGVDRGA